MAQYNEAEERAEQAEHALAEMRADLDRARRAGDQRVMEERARAEQAERERDEARSLVESRTTEAMVAQAERERAELDARIGWEAHKAEMAARIGWVTAYQDTLARAERAEAANAAWVRQADRIRAVTATFGQSSDVMGEALEELEAMRQAAHPGAALLERLRALESAGGYVLRDAFRPQTPELVDANGERVARVGWEWIERLRVALDNGCDECGMVGAHKLQCWRRA